MPKNSFVGLKLTQEEAFALRALLDMVGGEGEIRPFVRSITDKLVKADVEYRDELDHTLFVGGVNTNRYATMPDLT